MHIFTEQGPLIGFKSGRATIHVQLYSHRISSDQHSDWVGGLA